MEPQNTPIAPKSEDPEVAAPDNQTPEVINENTTTPPLSETSNIQESSQLAEPTVFSMDEPKPESESEPAAPEQATGVELDETSSQPVAPPLETSASDSISEPLPTSTEPMTPSMNSTVETDNAQTTQLPLENPAATGSLVDPAAVVPPVVPGRRIKKKWMIIGIIILAILVLGGGAAAAYVGYIAPHEPKYMVARAIGNSVSDAIVKTAHFDGDVTVKNPDSQTFKGSFKGQSGSNSAQITGSLGLDVTTLNFDMRVFGSDSAYVKIGGLNGLPQLLDKSGDADLSMVTPYINAINGQWISIDQSLLSSLGQSASNIGSSSLQVSPADAKRIENMYGDHPFLDVSKVHADETINGMNSNHYTVIINRSQLAAFGQELKDADIKNFPAITQDEINDIKKTDFSKYPVDVWIDKSRTIIDQVQFTTKQDDGTTVTARIAVSDINQPVSITKPTSSKSLLEILGDSSAMDMTGGGSMTMDNSTMTNLNALTN